jgi:hypothetical protein
MNPCPTCPTTAQVLRATLAGLPVPVCEEHDKATERDTGEGMALNGNPLLDRLAGKLGISADSINPPPDAA